MEKKMNKEEIIKQLKYELVALINNEDVALKSALKQAVTALLRITEDNIENWTNQLRTGAITLEEFEWLLKSQEQLIIMKALQIKGFSKLKVNSILNHMMEIVFNTLIRLIA